MLGFCTTVWKQKCAQTEKCDFTSIMFLQVMVVLNRSVEASSHDSFIHSIFEKLHKCRFITQLDAFKALFPFLLNENGHYENMTFQILLNKTKKNKKNFLLNEMLKVFIFLLLIGTLNMAKAPVQNPLI